MFIKKTKTLYALFFINVLFCLQIDIINQDTKVIVNDQIIDNPFLGGFNYPRNQWIDLDNDNINELMILDEDGCLRVYEYVNPENDSENSFFNIIDTAYGNLCGMSWFNVQDFDQDGDFELACQSLISGNQVQIYNIIDSDLVLIGTVVDSNENPIISDASMVPTFADIDSDGDFDFFTGNVIGTVTFYENVGMEFGLPIFDLVSFQWQNIWITGPSRHGASAITFIDIDLDDDLDLFWGDYFQRSLYFIENLGSSDLPVMDIDNIISDFPYNDPIYTAGRNMPSFNDIDLDGDLDLFISVLGGDGGIQLSDNFLFYENIDNSFSLKTTDFMNTIDLNSDVAPQMVDIDLDGDLDLFVGQDYDTSTFPIRGRIHFFRNIGNENQDLFQLEDDSFLGDDIGNSLVPTFADIDSDGDFDLFIGDYNGNIIFYKNIGDSSSMNFIYDSILDGIDSSTYLSPTFTDIDSDGDLDLFVGSNLGTLSFYRNVGSSFDYSFELVTSLFSNIDVGVRSHPAFIDYDLDGDQDLIVGSHNQNIKVYQNIGNSFYPDYLEPVCASIPYYGLNTKPNFYTYNNEIYSLTGLSTGGILASKIDYNIGDVNADNLINVIDAVIIVNYIAGNSELSFCLDSADLNSDQFVDILDIVILINQIIS